MLICLTLLFLYAFLAKTSPELLCGKKKKAFQVLFVCLLNWNKHQKENYFFCFLTPNNPLPFFFFTFVCWCWEDFGGDSSGNAKNLE